MVKSSKRTIIILLISSLILNVLFVADFIKNDHGLFSQNEIDHKEEINQPNSITYFVHGNEVFEKLPNDSNEVIMLGNSHTHNFEWQEIF